MFKKLILTLILTLTVSACGLEQYQSGDLPPKSVLSVIKENQHTREQVLRMLGAPAFTVEETNSIVYMRQMKESQVFFDPKEYERTVYVFTFNSKDVLKKIDRLTLADAQNIGFDLHVTPTQRKELSVTEQLIRNFGKYDAGGRDSTERI